MKTHFLLFITLLFCSVEFKAQTAQKVHLFEQFTSTSCPTCGNRNPEFYDEVLATYGEQVIHIAYHNHLPLAIDTFYLANISENRERSDFYNVKASPSLVLNGKLLSPARPLFKGSEVAAILEETSALKLELAHYKMDENFNVKVNAEILQNLPEGEYKMYVAVVEKEILYCTYFEYVFDNVFRAFLEEGNGVDFNLKAAGETQEFVKKIPLNNNWDYSMLYAVAFVQNTVTKEIVNAGASKISDKGESSRFSNDAFKLTAKVYHSSCGSLNGAIQLGVCVDAAPIEFPEDVSYKWSNGDTTQHLSRVSVGTYTVEITDNKHNTTIEQTFEILPSEGIEVEEIISPSNVANQNGSAEIIPMGSYGGFTIEWNDGNTNFNRNDLAKGTYYYLITDARGCQKENKVTIERDFTATDVAVNIKNVSCSGDDNGSVSINLINAAGGDVVLVFKDNILVQNTNRLSAGEYKYQLIDSFGDVLLEANFIITEPEILSTAIIVTEENQLVGEAKGGTPPYTFLWNDGTTADLINNPTNYDYSLIVTDANDCIAVSGLTFTAIELHQSQSAKATIFPNPVKNGNLVSVVSAHQIQHVEIFNIDGSQAAKKTLADKNSIMISNLDAGVYIVKVVFFSEEVEYTKLLVE